MKIERSRMGFHILLAKNIFLMIHEIPRFNDNHTLSSTTDHVFSPVIRNTYPLKRCPQRHSLCIVCNGD